MKEKFKWTLYLLYTTPVLMLITILAAGGGHGYPAPLFICFPWFAVLGYIDGGWVAMLAMALQLPVYGLIIDASLAIFGTGRYMKLVLVFLHIAVVIALAVKLNSESHAKREQPKQQEFYQ